MSIRDKCREKGPINRARYTFPIMDYDKIKVREEFETIEEDDQPQI